MLPLCPTGISSTQVAKLTRSTLAPSPSTRESLKNKPSHSAKKYLQLIKEWIQLGSEIHFVFFENLVEHTQEEAGKILRFLNMNNYPPMDTRGWQFFAAPSSEKTRQNWLMKDQI